MAFYGHKVPPCSLLRRPKDLRDRLRLVPNYPEGVRIFTDFPPPFVDFHVQDLPISLYMIGIHIIKSPDQDFVKIVL